MDEIDEELLKVTTSETSAVPQPTQADKKKIPADEEGEISESETEREKAKKKVKTNKRKRKGQVSESESEDEGFNDGYDEEMIGDEEDRKYLFSLPEIEREDIINQRFQKRKEEQEKRTLRKQMKQQQSGISNQSLQKTTRDRASAKKFKSKQSALSDLKKRRAKITGTVVSSSDDDINQRDESEDEEEDEEYSSDDYAEREREREKEREKEKERVSRNSSNRKQSRSRDSDSQRTSISSDSQDTSESLPITDPKEFSKITFTRKFLERYCEEPYFDKLCIGFFVRIGIGIHNGKSVYRVAEIKGVKEGSKLYTMGKTSTYKLLQLQHASSSAKHFTMEHVSNQLVSESEFHKWESEMKKAGLKIPTLSDVQTKVQQLNNIIENYRYSHEDVEKMIEKRKNLKGNMPMNFAAAKAELILKRDAAKDFGDMDEFEKLKVKIEELEIMEKEHALKIQDKTTLINQRNKQANQDVQYEEYTDSGPKQNDPFQRRQTRPTNAVVFNTQSSDLDPNSNGNGNDIVAAPSTAALPASIISIDPTTKLTSNNGDTPKANSTEDPDSTLRRAHDFDLESIPAKTVELTAAQLEAQRISNLSKKPRGATLSLEDYKRRRGLI